MSDGVVPIYESVAQDPEMMIALLAILVKKLGGEVLVTQDDIDQMADGYLVQCNEQEGLRLLTQQRITQ